MRPSPRAARPRAFAFACLLLALPLGCAADAIDEPSVESPSAQEGPIGQTSEAITAASIMTRAKEWVDQKVLYCAVANHKWDAKCGYTCERPAAAWDAYRSDCSGFVSWCWQISWQPSSGIYMTDRTGTDGWKTIPIDSLSAGDALVCNGHIMLFSRWVTSTSFEIYQESNCGKVANFGTRTFKRNADGTLLIGTDTRIYHPIRRNGLTAPTDAGVADASKPDSGADASKADAALKDAATSDVAPGDALAEDAFPDDALTDDAAPTEPDPTAPPDEGAVPGDDAPPAAAMSGSCAHGGSRGAAGGAMFGALAMAALGARRRSRRSPLPRG